MRDTILFLVGGGAVALLVRRAIRGWSAWLHLAEVFGLCALLGAVGGLATDGWQRAVLYGVGTGVIGTFSYWLYLWEPSERVKGAPDATAGGSPRDRRWLMVGLIAGLLTVPLALGIALTDGGVRAGFTAAAVIDLALGLSIAITLNMRPRKSSSAPNRE
jgi:hypothetical protein